MRWIDQIEKKATVFLVGGQNGSVEIKCSLRFFFEKPRKNPSNCQLKTKKQPRKTQTKTNNKFRGYCSRVFSLSQGGFLSLIKFLKDDFGI